MTSKKQHDLTLTYDVVLKTTIHEIQAKKINLADIDLLSMLDQYLSFLEKLISDKNIVNNTYLDLIAYLINLKSRWAVKYYMPALDEEGEGLVDIEQIREQMLEYRYFKEVAQELKALHKSAQQHLSKTISYLVPEGTNDKAIIFNKHFSPLSLQGAWERMLKRIKFSNFFEFMPMEKHITPLEMNEKIKLFLAKTTEEQWELLSFLKMFAHNLITLLCAFTIILDLIKHKKLDLEYFPQAEDYHITLKREELLYETN